MRRIATYLVISMALAVTGCKTNAAGEQSISLGPLIGLFGMAVDGDDKVDYEHLLNDCDCDGKCHCH